MDYIPHDNIFEYMSVDLDVEEDLLRLKLKQLGPKRFVNYLQERELSMFKTPTLLSTELRDRAGSILINKNIPLDKYLTTLLERYDQDRNFVTSPFSIQSSEEIIAIYQNKVTTKVGNHLNRVVTKQEKYRKFFAKMEKGELKSREQFEGFMNELLDNTEGISFMLKMIRGIDSHKQTFLHSANSTFVCLAVAMMHMHRSRGIDHKTFIKKTACIGFLQNAGLFSGLVSNKTSVDEKNKKSAMMIGKLCKDESMIEAVQHKHKYSDESGVPVFKDQASPKNFHKSLLMTVNLFIDIVHNNKFAPESIEVHKAMYELAKEGYADPKVVSLLGELFLPRIKFQLLEYAFKIQNQCSEKPVIWGVAGDMLPIRFICRMSECQHAGQHKTLVPQDVEVKADEIFETKTKAGIYFTCEFLTNRLQVKYKELQKQNEEF